MKKEKETGKKMNTGKEKNTVKKLNTKAKVGICIAAVAVVVVIVVVIVNVVRNRNAEEPVEEPTVDVGEPTKPSYTYGDADSDSFDFSGDYFDRAGEQTSMSITRGDEEGSYNVSILYQENDISTLAWEIEAVYDSETKALSYDGCTHMRYLLDPDDPEADPSYIELPGDGTGHIFMHDDALFWLDDADDMGNGMLFTERTAE